MDDCSPKSNKLSASAPTLYEPSDVDDRLPPPELASVDRYIQLGVLGRGGMGEVRVVEDRRIGREVALKVLTPALGHSADALQRFLREARVQGRLEHPSIVPVYDLGHQAGGIEFFTMKRVSGQTLEHLLADVGANRNGCAKHWTLPKLLGVFRQVCLAVEFAHSRFVVHRDLKPANIMVGDFGEVYVLDWGIAKLLHPSESESEPTDDAPNLTFSTMEGDVLGTPGYMAPEQIRSPADADERCDIYALGAILFEILTLEPLHESHRLAEVVSSTYDGSEGAARLRASTREVPPELAAITVRATAQERTERYGAVRELTCAIEAFIEGDRDLETRRRLAVQHARASEEAAARALSAGANAQEERARALSEAGKALALDPNAPGGLKTVLKLLQEPPHELPSAVREELAAHDRDVIMEAARAGLFVFAGFLLLCLVFMPLGIKSWAGLGMIILPLTLALSGCATGLYMPWEPGRARVMAKGIILCACLATAAASGLDGAMVLVPTLAGAIATACSVFTHTRAERLWLMAACLSSVLVPFLLEWNGLVPRVYVFRPGEMAIVSTITDVPEVFWRLGLTMASIGAMLAGAWHVWRTIDTLNRAQRHLALQTWQLQQLAALAER